jgi:hypothetical protein
MFEIFCRSSAGSIFRCAVIFSAWLLVSGYFIFMFLWIFFKRFTLMMPYDLYDFKTHLVIGSRMWYVYMVPPWCEISGGFYPSENVRDVAPSLCPVKCVALDMDIPFWFSDFHMWLVSGYLIQMFSEILWLKNLMIYVFNYCLYLLTKSLRLTPPSVVSIFTGLKSVVMIPQLGEDITHDGFVLRCSHIGFILYMCLMSLDV